MVEISTSLLNVKENAIKTFYNLETAHTDYFHIDVMDGKFVENTTSERMKEYVTILKQITNLPLDVHLMVEDVKEYVDEYIDFNPNIITFHIESIREKKEVYDIIKYIKENGIKIGIAIKPETKLEDIYEFLPYIHMVLIMTVEPGMGGQKFMKQMVNKISELKKYVQDNEIDIDIEVDGGINEETADLVKDAGANILVVGVAIINSTNYAETIKILKM